MYEAKKRILEDNRDELVEKITKIDIDIAVLEKMDPKKVMNIPLSKSSSREMTVEKMLELNKANREPLQTRLTVIEKMLGE